MTSKNTRDQRKAEGLCIDCGSPKMEKSCRCQRCRKRNIDACAARRARFKEAGLCIKCGKSPPNDGNTKCAKCLDRQMNAYRRRLKTHSTSNKQCLDCGNIAIGRFCETCHLKRVSVKRTGTVSNWELLQEKFRLQNGICPYTGKEITIGVDAALDHIVPKSLGGTDELSNLQWVLDKANEMKWNYAEAEFLDLIRLIYEHRIYQLRSRKPLRRSRWVVG